MTDLESENAALRQRLEVLEETVRAIREGDVDAVVVSEPEGSRVYTLAGADRPYRVLVEEMQQGAATLQDDGTIVWCNRRLAEMLQVAQERLIGTVLFDFFDRPAESRTEPGAFPSDPPQGGERSLRRSDGEIIPVFLTLSPLPPDSGAALGALVTDLTAQRHNEQLAAERELLRTSQRRLMEQGRTLQAERELLKVTLASIGDAVITTSRDGRVTFLNPLAESLTGWLSDEAAGQPLDAVYPLLDEPTRQRVETLSENSIRTGDPGGSSSHKRLVRRDGAERPIEDSVAPVRNGTGDIFGYVLVFRDVTERRLTQRAIEESEQRLRIAVGAARLGQWTLDLKTNELTTSLLCRANFGRDPEDDFTYGLLWELVHPDDRTRVQAAVRTAIATRTDYDTEYRTVWPNGSIHWVMVRGRTTYAQDGTPLSMSGVTLDITDRKEVERRVVESEAHFRSMADNAPTMLWVTNETGYCTYLSKSWYDFTGRSPEQDLGFGWLENVHPDDRTKTERTFLESTAQRGTFQVDYRLRRHDGQYRWATDAGLPRTDEAGVFRGYVGTVSDIHERRTAEMSLLERTTQLDMTLDATGIGMWLNSMPLDQLNWDDRTRSLFFVPDGAEPTVDLFWSRLHPDDREPTRQAIKDAIQNRALYSIDHRVVSPTDQEIRWLRSAGKATYDFAGTPTRFEGINYDITDRKRLEEELRQHAAALSDADRQKDEFLAMLAHELRNPLAPIRSGLYLLTMSDSADRETVEVMQSQVEHMVRLVDDLLDVSRIMRGKIQLRKVPVELSQIVRRATETSMPLLDTQEQRLEVSLPANPIWVDGDPVRLTQVFSNLLNNASKYTDKHGRIALMVEPQEALVRVCVRDNGIGIDEDLLSRLFDLFAQGDRSLERSQGGLGIGLTVVKHLLEMHGGTVTAHSDGIGAGSEFHVILPTIQHAGIAAQLSDAVSAQERRRILVVDDNRGAAKLLAKLLEKLGPHEIRVAYDGHEALQVAKQFRPELLLLDIGLPSLNGYEVTKILRSEPDFDAALLVAMTGYGTEQDRRRALECGFDMHLVKPPSLEALCSIFQHPKFA
jgi:PAS domain S-box-containing protein